jgi:hypothetical protein
MKLKIEDGFLLKPYAAPFNTRTGKHNILDGWTPDRTPAMQALFDELRAETGPGTPPFIVWKQVEIERGKELAQAKRPYPGWISVNYKLDKNIGDAYRELFLRMNPAADRRVEIGGVWSGTPTVSPPDGDYVLDGGEMRPSL